MAVAIGSVSPSVTAIVLAGSIELQTFVPPVLLEIQ